MAAEALHSTKFNIDVAVRELAESTEDLSLMRAYISIQTAAQLTGPPGASEVDAALKTLRAAEEHLDQLEFGEILAIHRDLAGLFWRKKHMAMLKEKLGMGENSKEAEMEAGISRLQHRLHKLLSGEG